MEYWLEKMDVIYQNNILGIFTCYNRKKKTLSCLKSIVEGNPELNFRFLAVDDASADGTSEELERLDNVKIVQGTGSLYYSGGMRKGIAEAKMNCRNFDYCLLFNDDVDFFPEAIEKMVKIEHDYNALIDDLNKQISEFNDLISKSGFKDLNNNNGTRGKDGCNI